MWTALTVLSLCAGLGAFGAVCYRAGRKSAENKAFKTKEQENANVDKVISSASALGRDACLKRLRNHQQ